MIRRTDCMSLGTSNCSIVYYYISPHLAATCCGYSPPSGSSQPNSLKLPATKYSLRCYANERTDCVIQFTVYKLYRLCYSLDYINVQIVLYSLHYINVQIVLQLHYINVQIVLQFTLYKCTDCVTVYIISMYRLSYSLHYTNIQILLQFTLYKCTDCVTVYTI
jgi:hypothetical protein